MRKLNCVLAVLVAGMVGRAIGQAPAGAGDPMAVISWIAGDWEAEATAPGPNARVTKVVNHYRPILGGKALSIETTFNGAERYRGLMGYDPAKKAVTMWYLMSTGESTSGTVMPGDGYALVDFVVTSGEGKATHLQVHMQRLDSDHYRWEMYADPKGAGMAKLFEITYHRLK